MNKFVTLGTLFSLLFVAGCQSTRVKPESYMIDHFEKGITTYGEVLSLMGKPNAVSANSNGIKVATYQHIDTNVHAATYIPIFGPFLGGASSETKMMIFKFKDNILEDINFSEASSEFSMGNYY